eukprot:GILK01007082.1.p1 GENE.GILK01007082.1~~GILK01007082.1.p1  ORF type:complete len:267 (-),score=19.47 GILK01007082.1:182-931(-)
MAEPVSLTVGSPSASPPPQALEFVSFSENHSNNTNSNLPHDDPYTASGHNYGKMGVAQNYFGSRGLGWMLEEDDDDLDGAMQRPILEELEIDPAAILKKIHCVLVPTHTDRNVLVDQSDFWGPFFVVIGYATLLVWGQLSVISWIMTIWLVGSFIVFFLTRVLGGEVSYGTALSVLGYSILPLVLVTLVLTVLRASGSFAGLLKLCGTLWAAYSAGSLLVSPQLHNKRVLVMYPILLLYIYLVSLHSGV